MNHSPKRSQLPPNSRMIFNILFKNALKYTDEKVYLIKYIHVVFRRQKGCQEVLNIIHRWKHTVKLYKYVLSVIDIFSRLLGLVSMESKSCSHDVITITWPLVESPFNKLTPVFHASVLLLIVNFVITLSK